jgi:hypothetical protein
MIRGTTPILTFKVNTELDFNTIKKAEVTFKSASGTKEKTWGLNRLIIDAEEHKLFLYLNQEETLYFSTGKIDIQLRIKLDNDMVYASKIVTSTLDKILKEGVI